MHGMFRHTLKSFKYPLISLHFVSLNFFFFTLFSFHIFLLNRLFSYFIYYVLLKTLFHFTLADLHLLLLLVLNVSPYLYHVTSIFFQIAEKQRVCAVVTFKGYCCWISCVFRSYLFIFRHLKLTTEKVIIKQKSK